MLSDPDELAWFRRGVANVETRVPQPVLRHRDRGGPCRLGQAVRRRQVRDALARRGAQDGQAAQQPERRPAHHVAVRAGDRPSRMRPPPAWPTSSTPRSSGSRCRTPKNIEQLAAAAQPGPARRDREGRGPAAAPGRLRRLTPAAAIRQASGGCAAAAGRCMAAARFSAARISGTWLNACGHVSDLAVVAAGRTPRSAGRRRCAARAAARTGPWPRPRSPIRCSAFTSQKLQARNAPSRAGQAVHRRSHRLAFLRLAGCSAAPARPWSARA